MSQAAPQSVRVRVPATSANLGPGFDCLGLALDLWNETTITLAGERLTLLSEGEGREIPLDGRNMVLQGMRTICEARGVPFPRGLAITCRNNIPISSGLGSSAAAALTGLLGMAALLGQPLGAEEALALSVQMEGHADNAAAALLGGLVVVSAGKEGWLVRRIEAAPMILVVALPNVRLSTQAARAALPGQVLMADATFNLGRVTLVVEAMRSGDFDLLRQAMDDRLHMPYRLPLIPGGQSALEAAYGAGASAVTISGAGPSLIAFIPDNPDGPAGAKSIAKAMAGAFEANHAAARTFTLHASPSGASVEFMKEISA